MTILIQHIFGKFPLATARIRTLAANKKALGLAHAFGFRETGRIYASPDPVSGFTGGTALILDCRAHEFMPFLMTSD